MTGDNFYGLEDLTQQMTIVRGQLREKDEETANLQNQATVLRTDNWRKKTRK